MKIWKGKFGKKVLCAGLTAAMLFTGTFGSAGNIKRVEAEGAFGNVSADAIVQLALGEEGYKEKNDASEPELHDKEANAGSNNYTKYAKEVGVSSAYGEWCGYFTWWVFKYSGVSTEYYPQSAMVSGIWNWFNSRGLYRGKAVYDPRPGDVIFCNGFSNHVGLVEKYEDGIVYTIEGNSSDEVTRRAYDINSSRVTGFGIVLTTDDPDNVLEKKQIVNPDGSIDPWSPLSVPIEPVYYGDESEDVLWVQTFLNKFYDAGLVEDGEYGSGTYKAITAYQEKKGLPPDGTVSMSMIDMMEKEWKGEKPSDSGSSSGGNTGSTEEENPGGNESSGGNDNPGGNTSAQNPWGNLTVPTGTLRRGSSGAQVKWLQTFLNYYLGTNLETDGEFGGGTERAVIAYQEAKGLDNDGIAGSMTIAAAKKDWLAGEKLEVKDVKLSQIVYMQSYGERDSVGNGEATGIIGKSLRMEAVKLSVSGDSNLGITYRTHIQNYGWMSWKNDGELSGTTGESKRMEALQIELTGSNKNSYDVYYRTHAQNYGWLGWAKNGEMSGTAGLSKRLEAIQVVIVKKGESVPDSLNGVSSNVSSAFVEKRETPVQKPEEPKPEEPKPEEPKPQDPPSSLSAGVNYQTHVQTYGWQDWKSNGDMAGTSGESKRLEGIKITLDQHDYSGSIQYTTHVQTYGWLDYVSDGEMSGTSGESKRLEAIRIQLSGEVADVYDVYYRVHAQNYGWLGWAKNGDTAGTAGMSKRLEGIQIVLVRKGEDGPGLEYNGISSAYEDAFFQ